MCVSLKWRRQGASRVPLVNCIHLSKELCGRRWRIVLCDSRIEPDLVIGVSRKQFWFIHKNNFLPFRAVEQLGVVPFVQVSSRWLGIFKQPP